MLRTDARVPDQLRPFKITPHFAPYSTGSVLVETGNTRVICAITIEPAVPRWMKEQKVPGGWLTAEYSMLPYSTLSRKQRDITKGKLEGRTQEIQRLIGRSIRAAVDLDKVGENTIWIDCDVVQADGGTRTASITGAYVALVLAINRLLAEKKLRENPIKDGIAAVSIGIVDDVPLLDLCYEEDVKATVDMNVVMTESGRIVEIQGSGEESTFSEQQMQEMFALAKRGIRELAALQKSAIAAAAKS